MRKSRSNFFRMTGSIAIAKRIADRAYMFCETQVLPEVIEGEGISNKDFWVLHTIVDIGNAPRSLELAHNLGLDKSVISRSINKLVERKLIIKVFADENQRSFGLKETKIGSDCVNRFNKITNDLLFKFESGKANALGISDELVARQLLNKLDDYTAELAKYDYSESETRHIKNLIRIG